VEESQEDPGEDKPSSIWSEKAALVLAQAGGKVDKRGTMFLGINAWRMWKVTRP
jgi:hypothetical protein